MHEKSNQVDVLKTKCIKKKDECQRYTILNVKRNKAVVVKHKVHQKRITDTPSTL